MERVELGVRYQGRAAVEGGCEVSVHVMGGDIVQYKNMFLHYYQFYFHLILHTLYSWWKYRLQHQMCGNLQLKIVAKTNQMFLCLHKVPMGLGNVIKPREGKSNLILFIDFKHCFYSHSLTLLNDHVYYLLHIVLHLCKRSLADHCPLPKLLTMKITWSLLCD